MQYNLQSHKVCSPFVGATKVTANSLSALRKQVGGQVGGVPAAVNDESDEEWDPDA